MPQQPMQFAYPPQQMGAPQAYPQQAPQIIYQPVVQVQAMGTNYLTCGDVLCNCTKPNFDSCGECCGCMTAVFPGAGLVWGCCCYGCQKADCCQVCCAGCGMGYTSFFIFGIVSGCLVGCKMMGCIM